MRGPGRRLRGAVLALAAAAVALSAGCSAGPPPPPPGPPAAATVRLQDVQFDPVHVTIHVGQTVRWVWDDAPLQHNVSVAGVISPTQSSGTWTHTFTTAGTFDYRCTIHFDMRGVVTVES